MISKQQIEAGLDEIGKDRKWVRQARDQFQNRCKLHCAELQNEANQYFGAERSR